MKYLLSLLLLLSASVFVSCEKDEDKTPRPTPRTEKELLEEYRARYPQLDLSGKADQRVQTLLGPTRRLTEAEMHKALDGTSWVLHVERKIKTDGALEPYMGWFSHTYGSLTFKEGKVQLTETAALPNRPEAPFETYTYDEKKNEIKATEENMKKKAEEEKQRALEEAELKKQKELEELERKKEQEKQEAVAKATEEKVIETKTEDADKKGTYICIKVSGLSKEATEDLLSVIKKHNLKYEKKEVK